MNELSIDSNKDVQLLIMETDKLQVNIQADSIKIKKLKETSIVQDGFIKNMRLEIYFTFKKTDNKAEIKKIITVNETCSICKAGQVNQFSLTR